jgi:hypothetical protein
MVNADELQSLISKCLRDFYERRVSKLEKLSLKTILRRKNPYLFRALGTQKASEIVEKILIAYIGASDETIFGNAFFEPIARIASGAKVSDAEGVDFVIETKDRILAVALKSGPNIYNASQKKRQSQEFLALRSRLYKLNKQFDPMLGHAYGRARSEPTKDTIYRRRSGEDFWTEITGDPDFYRKLITLMKEEPIKHKRRYDPAWDAAINRFSAEFIRDFCFENGNIDWEKLAQFVSGTKNDKTTAKNKKIKVTLKP